MAELTALGTVKTIKMLTMDNPQPSPNGLESFQSPDAVHRLDVGGGKKEHKKDFFSLKV